MNVFIISLERQRHKLERMYTQLKGSEDDLILEHVVAVDGRSVSNRVLRSFTTTFGYWTLLPTSIACALSHYNVWKAMVDQKLPYALIMEDDLIISQAHIQFIKQLLIKLPNKWRYVNLSMSTPSGAISYLFRAVMCRKLKDPVLFMMNEYQVIDAEIPLTTGCYLLSLDGAKELIKRFFPMYIHIDIQIAIIRPFPTLAISPPLINFEASLQSDIVQFHHADNSNTYKINLIRLFLPKEYQVSNKSIFDIVQYPFLILGSHYISLSFFHLTLLCLSFNSFYGFNQGSSKWLISLLLHALVYFCKLFHPQYLVWISLGFILSEVIHPSFIYVSSTYLLLIIPHIIRSWTV